MRVTGRTTSAVLALAAAGLLVAGCGGGGEDASGGASAAKPAAAPDQRSAGGGTAERDAVAPGDGKSSGSGSYSAPRPTSARVVPNGREIVYRAQISVRVKDVAAAAARAESLATGVNGVVFAEETVNDPDSPEANTAHLTLRVPPEDFRDVLTRLGRLGKRLSQSQTAEDVTTQVVDTESRVESQKRSVARVRALLAEANTIGEVVQVESELARREADLESLESQLARLKDVTELATIDVDLVGPTAPEPKPEDDEDLGFLAGLRGGWDAFGQIVLVALTVLGALLPFVLAVGIVGVPAWLLVRSRVRRAPASEPPAGAAST